MSIDYKKIIFILLLLFAVGCDRDKSNYAASQIQKHNRDDDSIYVIVAEKNDLDSIKKQATSIKFLEVAQYLGAFPVDELQYFNNLQGLIVANTENVNIHKLALVLKKCKSINTIAFIGTNLKMIPSGISKIPTLVNINLSYNSIEKIVTRPEDDYSKIKQFDIEENKIKIFRDEFTKFTNLEDLKMGCALGLNLYDLCSTLSKYRKLKYLKLVYPYVFKVPKNIELLNQLNEIYLKVDQITNGLQYFAALKNLKSLNIDVKHMTITQGEIAKLQKQLPHCSILIGHFYAR